MITDIFHLSVTNDDLQHIDIKDAIQSLPSDYRIALAIMIDESIGSDAEKYSAISNRLHLSYWDAKAFVSDAKDALEEALGEYV